MPYCSNCGAQTDRQSRFCSACGAEIPKGAGEETKTEASEQKKAFVAEDYDEARDAENNRAVGILSYLIGLLVLIPAFVSKNSPFTKFHANQGLVMIIMLTAAYIATAIFTAIIAIISPVAAMVLGIILYIGVAVFAIIFVVKGIISAAKGRKDPLPIIGGIKILK